MSKAWGKILLASCLGLLCFIALTPLLLSTSFGTSLLLKALNKNIPGSIEIKELSLSWLGAQQVKGFTLKSKENEPVLFFQMATIDAPLLFLGNMKNLSEVKVEGGTLKIEQDAEGATNLEDALGLKRIEKPTKTPVLVENAELFFHREPNGLISLKAKGLTHQNTFNGQFSLDLSLSENGAKTIDLHAEHFPTLVLDQTLAISNPRLSGILLTLLGDSIELSAHQEEGMVQLSLQSPSLQGNIQGRLSKEQLLISEGSSFHFSLQPQNLEKLKTAPFQFLEPLEGEITIQGASIPVNPKLFQESQGEFAFKLNPSRVKFKGKAYELKDFTSFITAKKNTPHLRLNTQLKAIEDNKPISLKIEANLPKTFDQLKTEGIRFTSQLTSPKVMSTWEGNLKEKGSEIKGALRSETLSFKEMQIKAPYIPFQEILEGNSSFEGTIILYSPEWNATALGVDEVVLPWHLEDNTLNLSLTGIFNNKEIIKGSLRADQINNLQKSSLQINLKLEDFHIEGIHALFPSQPLKRLLGSTLDAGITASKDPNGKIEGCMDITAPKNSDVFLKRISSRFSTENQQDMTFDAETQQAIGTTRFSGTFHDIWDEKGRIRLNDVSLQGNLKHFPVCVMTNIITGDEKIAESMEAVLGCQVDAELYTEIKNQKGPISASMKGLNGQCLLNGKIENQTFFLSEPITASLKVTPQLEHTILRKYLPILGSVLSAEKPLELLIPVEGFRLPLNPLSLEQLQFHNAELQLNKMQFLKDSPLGKIVSLIGVQSSQFEVWFTPIYFSLQKGMMRMERTDMLVANAYPFAAWGIVDLNQQEIDMTVGISPHTLTRAFSLDIKSPTWFQVPIKGSISHPKIDSVTAMARLSALAATSRSGPPGKLIGTVIETAADLIGDKVPPSTTEPLPWANQIEEPSPTQTLDKPVEELKKGAKKLLKELFK